ncbi:MAG: undecaprenyl-diphosphate phosphatase, partial [Thermoproteota archaeon]
MPRCDYAVAHQRNLPCVPGSGRAASYVGARPLDAATAALVGALQGFLEWLPVSSSGQVVLTASALLGVGAEVSYSLSLFLHLGTLVSAIVYYRREVFSALSSLARFDLGDLTLRLWLVATPASLAVGYPLYLAFTERAGKVALDELSAAVGAALISVAVWLYVSSSRRGAREPNTLDLLLLGVAQGVAALPGISRSGVTIAILLTRRVAPQKAVRLSFLASIPVTLAAGIYTAFSGLGPTPAGAAAASLLSSFAAGLAGIRLMELAGSVLNLAQFALVIGAVLVAVGLVSLAI